MTGKLDARLDKLEARRGMNLPRIWSVKFKPDPGDGSKPEPPKSGYEREQPGRRIDLWGGDSDIIFVKPGQSEAGALRAAGIHEQDTVICWGDVP